MKRPLTLTLFVILTAIIALGVLVIATGSKDVYEKTFSVWYFYSTIVLLLSWLVSMCGLWFMKPWAACLCVVTAMTHHLTLLVAGAWSISQLPLLVVPMVFIGWAFKSESLTRRLKIDAQTTRAN